MTVDDFHDDDFDFDFDDDFEEETHEELQQIESPETAAHMPPSEEQFLFSQDSKLAPSLESGFEKPVEEES